MAHEKLQVKIGGMACSFCTETIKKGLGRMDGVSEVFLFPTGWRRVVLAVFKTVAGITLGIT